MGLSWASGKACIAAAAPNSGRPTLEEQDQVTLALQAYQRNYHSALMGTVVVGRAHAPALELFDAAVTGLEAC